MLNLVTFEAGHVLNRISPHRLETRIDDVQKLFARVSIDSEKNEMLVSMFTKAVVSQVSEYNAKGQRFTPRQGSRLFTSSSFFSFFPS